jgi:hypothetical protein
MKESLTMNYFSRFMPVMGLKPILNGFLPEIGVIVDDKVAMFLMETNTSLCFITHLISLKGASNKHHLIALGADYLMRYAKKQGYKRCMIFTENEYVEKVCINNGGQLTNCRLIQGNLSSIPDNFIDVLTKKGGK